MGAISTRRLCFVLLFLKILLQRHSGAYLRKSAPVGVSHTTEHSLNPGEECLYLDPLQNDTTIVFFDALDHNGELTLAGKVEISFKTKQVKPQETALDLRISRASVTRRGTCRKEEICPDTIGSVQQTHTPTMTNHPAKRCLGGEVHKQTEDIWTLTRCISEFRSKHEDASALEFTPKSKTTLKTVGICKIMQTCDKLGNADGGTLVIKRDPNAETDYVYNWVECDCGDAGGCERITLTLAPSNKQDLRIHSMYLRNQQTKMKKQIRLVYPLLGQADDHVA